MKKGETQIVGRSFSVYSPLKVRQGLQLWTQSLIQVIGHRGAMSGSHVQGCPEDQVVD